MMRKRSSTRAPRGVTLVELMVVVALIGILAAVASPTVGRAIDRANARGVANEVANQLRIARNQAMSRGEPLWVSMADQDTGTTEGGTIAIWRQTGTEVTPEVDCPDGYCGAGQICKCPLNDADCDRVDRNCFENVPRTCREGFDTANWRLLQQVEISEVDANYSLRVIRPQEACPLGLTLPASTVTVPCDTMVCFEPDGRVFRQNGLLWSQLSASEVCSTESVVAFTGPDSESTLPSLNCATTDATRKAQSEAWDETMTYKISVPYNGAVKVMR